MKWDTVIEEKTNELARHLNGRTETIAFIDPVPFLARTDNRVVRDAILNVSQRDAIRLGIGKSTLHYLRSKARSDKPFRMYRRVAARLE